MVNDEKTRKPLHIAAEAAGTPAAGQDAMKHHLMTREQAKKYIACLTREEKQKLNELLKALEQKRPLSPVPPRSTGEDD